ncbi:MAG: manganese efflux pump [Clostridia bacterium]|nr:manganese efflux pump [Clostridia bacterium]
MGAFDVVLLGIALSMDACAVGLTNGMTMPKLGVGKAVLIALFFGVFQALMPLIGYFVTDLLASHFMATFEKVSSVLSFVILAALGGKMIYDGVKEIREKRRAGNSPSCVGCENAGEALEEEKSLPLGKLFLQALATSIDALAVGVTLKMAAISGGIAFGVFGAVGMIGFITLGLSFIAVQLGKKIGAGLADKAEIVGGVMLILIGLKLLFEGLL